MKIWERDQELAQKTGEGVWLWDGAWYELYIDNDGEWSANASRGSSVEGNTLAILPEILKHGIKMERRHYDAIERVDAPAEQAPLGSCRPYGYCEVCKEDYVQLVDDDCATEAIIDNLIMARTVSDAETAVGYVRDAATGDIFKVTIDYLGNNPDEKD